MKIAVTGAGYTGIVASYYLVKAGFDVTLIEKETYTGGLAASFKDKNWRWSLEHHYHHLFTTDQAILKLAKEVGHEINFKTPKTSIYFNNKISDFDTPISLLKFPHLSKTAKLRTGLVIVFLKLNPFWKPLEKISAVKFLKTLGGEESWKVLWHPLFASKFGNKTKIIPTSWFWARIKKRSNKFGYPDGGFEAFYKTIEQQAQNMGLKVILKSEVTKIEKTENKITITTKNKSQKKFDKVICTLPSPIFAKITKGLSKNYLRKVKNTKNCGAINIIISLNKKLLPNKTYWLNINDIKFPFLGVVEHTNFISKTNYDNNHLVYIGNYLPSNHKHFKISKSALLKIYFPYLKRINPNIKHNWITKSWKFSSPYAQPIMDLNFSKNVPEHITPIQGLYLANMQQVYPWDRQTNYAAEMGKKIAKLIIKTSSL